MGRVQRRGRKCMGPGVYIEWSRAFDEGDSMIRWGCTEGDRPHKRIPVINPIPVGSHHVRPIQHTGHPEWVSACRLER